MDLMLLGIEWLPSQIQAVNPILIMLYIPVFSYGVYPLAARFVELTSLRKIGTGLFVAAAAFVIVAWIEQRIVLGEQPNVAWQILAYAVLTAGEVLVSMTCLEFSYTQAPKTMKSVVMSLYLISVAAGNLFTSAVNALIRNADGTTKLEGASYYLFFATVMLVAAVTFVGVATRYHGRMHLQDDDG